MLVRHRTLLAGVGDFVDSAYLRGQRPRVPGGAWTVDLLRVKSVADLQQLWFMLLRERNMLHSMRDHYMRHTEELGAFPAPSRITFVEESMRNIRAVMKERDFKAVDKAEAIFKERIAKGIYRYPPGPQPDITAECAATTSVVQLTLSQRVDEAQLREILGRYDVFDSHRGIVSLVVEPTPETLQQKEAAEQAFEHWSIAKRDFEEYSRLAEKTSYFDRSVDFELAPGVFLEEEIVAAQIEVPPTKTQPRPGNTPLERLRATSRTYIEKQVIQFPYYPNVTQPAPPEPGERPTHPDEIVGPWHCTVVYGVPGGLEYVQSLEVKRIYGADVLEIADKTAEHIATINAAQLSEEYVQALAEEEASAAELEKWPAVPKWKPSYAAWSKQKVGDIIKYNYSNVVDYVDREALLTGKSILEPPLRVDPTCGKAEEIPPHAEPTKHLVPRKPLSGEY